MTYCDILRKSARMSGSCACIGLDPRMATLPPSLVPTGAGTGAATTVRASLVEFFSSLLTAVAQKELVPAAFKPNLGYWHCLDNPRQGEFAGSLALVDVLALVEQLFPGIPIILDSKRGDIASSSANYAEEAFTVWQAHAVTVSPYMGTDSVMPFVEEGTGEKGVYVLNRTSNPGAADLQGLVVEGSTGQEPLYLAVARQIVRWNNGSGCVGAVVGATSSQELAHLAGFYADKDIPLLIPGVGSQGAGASATVQLLKAAGYPVELARINSSSGITMPWKNTPAPSGWLDVCVKAWESLLKETSL